MVDAPPEAKRETVVETLYGDGIEDHDLGSPRATDVEIPAEIVEYTWTGGVLSTIGLAWSPDRPHSGEILGSDRWPVAPPAR